MGRVFVILAGLAFFGGTQQVFGQSFTDISAGLTAQYYGSVDWGDYDNDGDLDIIQTGYNGSSGGTQLYRNDGGGTFAVISVIPHGLYYSDAEWGDYDSDGDLDLAINGYEGTTGNYISKVFRNDGSDSFTEVASLTGVRRGTVEWGDYDNDGDLDLVQSGQTSSSAYISEIYRNDSGTFNNISAGLSGVYQGATSWGDFDSDGDLDLLLAGYDGASNISKIYRNDGGGIFSDISAGLTGISQGEAAWGDYDNDGDLDILLNGSNISYVYRNDGSGVFTNISAGLAALSQSSAAWGDYDNDGDLDILQVGYSGSYHSEVYQNNGDGTFSSISAGLQGLRYSEVAWGDYDGDGDLDILQQGYTSSGGYATQIYQNNSSITNTAPPAPSNLNATVTNDTTVTLSWDAASDSETASAGLYYNVYVGYASGQDNFVSGQADLSSGVRRIAKIGQIKSTSFTITGLSTDSTYYWSVQAIDAALEGGAFASEQSFGPTVVPLTFSDISAGLTALATGDGNWGDYDNDGDLDIVQTGNSGGTHTAEIYQNDGSGTFSSISAGLTGVDLGSADWGDYDNDGDLDLLISGETSTGRISEVYRNDGSGTFTSISAGLTAVSFSSSDWGDYDNDGDLDILLTGYTGTTYVSQIYRNDGSDTFTNISAGLTGVNSGSSQWGDYDEDGDLDILLTGSNGTTGTSTIYRNDGKGTFVNISAGLTGHSEGDAAWGDYDNDGDLDLVQVGYTGTTPISEVYRNDGSGTFTNISAGLTGVQDGSVSWGDYDNDGDLDIYQQGNDGTSDIARIYCNDGSDSFTDISAGLAGSTGFAAWGDYDNDGDLDILNVAGGTIYDNDNTVTNVAPSEPANLQSTATDTSLTLTWDAPTDSETPSAALTYNVYLGTASGSDDNVPAEADLSTGFRRLSQIGQVDGTSLIVNGLNSATRYFWSVQAVDAGLKGGEFAAEQSATTINNVGFTDLAASIDSVSASSLDWGDYDNDGDLDILMTGIDSNTRISAIYQNNGDSTFTDIAAGLEAVDEGDASWGDYDNDGYLDIILAGFNGSSYVSNLYHNNGDGTFSRVALFGGATQGSTNWVDYDNDGDLDIHISGYNGSLISTIYNNNGDGSFSEISAGLTGLRYSSADWGDYDNDGDLDLLQSGHDGTTYRTEIYNNNGDGTFSGAAVSGLADVGYSSTSWGDYDNDGDLDILLSGYNGSSYVSLVYRNDGSGTFTNINAGLTGVYQGEADWGDYDNDGDLDILLTGYNASHIGHVYKNNGDDTFTNVSAGLTGIRYGSSIWGDYNNDGNLDILVAGQNSSGQEVTKLYSSNSILANNPPAAPTNLAAVVSDTSATLRWDPASDLETPAQGLSYNIYMGSASGQDDILPAQSDLSNGYRRLAKIGQVDDTTLTVNGLDPNTTYYWSVQTVDAGFEGSEFASEETIQTAIPEPAFTNISASLTGLRYASVAWGDYDNDSDLDFIQTGQTSSGTMVSEIYRNDGSGAFTKINAGLTGLYDGFVAWGDYDNDGDLDLLLSGRDNSSVSTTKIYRNDGTDSFTDISAGLQGMYDGEGAWGDYDNDGDLDILLTGRDNSANNYTRIYRNDGSGVFSYIGAGLTQVTNSSAAWGDYDNDGDLDILISGYSSSGGYVTQVYRNDGPTGFTDISASLTGLRYASVAWGDYDNDGDLDVLQAGQDSNSNYFSQVFRNDGSGIFTNISAGLTGVYQGSVAWGDYDNDGDLDILLSGHNNSANYVSQVYRNDGLGIFTDPSAGVTGLYQSSISWGDYDNDGDLDILQSGYNGSYITEIYENDSFISNTAPAAPSNLSIVAENDTTVTLSWNEANDSETPAAGVDYNVYVGTASGEDNIAPAQSEVSTGYRRFPAAGIVNGTQRTITGLDPSQTYYWSVQAVDAGLTGGSFATEQSFSFDVDPAEQFSLLSATGIDSLRESATAFGDFDNDGDWDLAISGTDGSENVVTKIYQNNGDETFTDIGAGLEAVTNGDLAWADFDNDGDLDLLVSGYSSANSAGYTNVYENQGSGTFSATGELATLSESAAKWGDLNNDGYVDFVIGGHNTASSQTETLIYINEKGMGFALLDESSTLLPAVSSVNSDHLIDLGDFDNDGDPDVLLTGNATAAIYRNDDLSFTDISAGLNALSSSSAKWVDYDADGDLDAITVGLNSSDAEQIYVYANNGDGTFTEDTGTGLAAYGETGMAWGDYDADGYSDVVLSGYVGSTKTSTIFTNNGDGSFSEFEFEMPGITNGALEFAHINSDSKLDLVISGADTSGTATTNFYANSMLSTNDAPSGPSSLTATVQQDSVVLSWSAASDAETSAELITYNVRVGTSSGAADVMAASFVSGQDKLMIPGYGNAQNNTSFTLKDLINGTYYWSVQAVDAGMNASSFASEGTFEMSGLLSKYSISLDGSDDNVNFGTPGILSGSSALTISSWIKPAVAGGSSKSIVAERDPDNNFYFGIVNGNLAFSKWTGDSESQIIGETALQADTWYHVAVTYDGSEAILYLDGNVEARKLISGALDSNTSTLYLGAFDAGSGFFQGDIYDLKIWNKVRSQFAINDSVNIALSGDESDLAAYWPLAEGTGTTTSDLSGNAISGTLQNGAAWSTDIPNPEMDVTAPAVPTGLSASVSGSDVNLSWNSNSEGDLEGYRLYRRSSSETEYKQLAFISAGTTSYTDASLTSGVSYYYSLSAVDNILNESELQRSGAVPVLDEVSEAESNDTTTDADGLPINGRASGEISTSDDIDYYQFSGTSGDFIEINLTTSDLDAKIELFNSSSTLLKSTDLVATGTEKLFYGINSTSTYYIKITYWQQSSTSPSKARLGIKDVSPDGGGQLTSAGGGDGSDTGPQTAAETGTYTLDLFQSEPVIPELDFVSTDLDGAITLNWLTTHADSYQVYRSTSSSSGFTLIDTITRHDYVDATVSNGTEYFYRIKSVYEATGVTSEFSDIVSGTAVESIYDLNAGYPLEPVTLDGSLATGEWDLAVNKDIGINENTVQAYAQNDGDSLYLALQHPDASSTDDNEFFIFLDLNQNGTLDGNDGYYSYLDTDGSGTYSLQFTPSSGSYPNVSFGTEAVASGARAGHSGTDGMTVELAISLTGSNTPMSMGQSVNIYFQSEIGDDIQGVYPEAGLWSAPATYIPLTLSDGPVPSPPSGITTSVGPGQITLDWDDNHSAEEVTSYRIYRSTDNASFSQITSSSSSDFTNTSLTDGVTYYYYLTAINTYGKVSVPSDTISATPSQDGPDLLSISPAPGSLVTRDSVITLTFDQAISSVSIGSGSGGVLIEGDESGANSFSDVGEENSQTVKLSLSPSSVFATETIRVTLRSGTSSSSLRNTDGVGFDGNGNGMLDGSDDDSTFTYNIAPLGDFNVDGKVEFEDLAELANVWDTDFDKELGPVTGTFPYIGVNSDGQFDIEDMLSFIWFWNWTADGNSMSKTGGSNDQFAFSMSQAVGGKSKRNDKENGFINNKITDIADVSGGGAADYISFVPKQVPDKYQTLDAPNADKRLGYDLNVAFPDSLLGVEVVVKYDPQKARLRNIHDAKVFETVKGRTIFLSKVDTLKGVAVINTVNFGNLGIIKHKPLATLNFELLGKEMGEVTVAYDIRNHENKSTRAGSRFTPVGSTIEMPEQFVLEQNYPNPFNPQTTIQYQIAEKSRVRIMVYNILGRRVATLVDSQVNPGYYRMHWNAARHLASGMYLYVMDIKSEAGRSHREVKKMLLVK